MSDLVSSRLRTYQCETLEQEKQALREIIQEAALAGLWRGKFFEHAAFYGGTALRLFHNLDRFSEDLDFTLLRKTSSFKLASYFKSVADELKALGFEVDIESKRNESTIDSAFVKTNTLKCLILVGSPFKTHRNENLSIKFEVDTDPALGFETEVRSLAWPFLFSVVMCDLHSLFAGKLHALICRERILNIKGKDLYDTLWYLARKIPAHQTHLTEKLRQNGVLVQGEEITLQKCKDLILSKIEKIDMDQAKRDIQRFIRHPERLDGWTKENFVRILQDQLTLTSQQ